MVGANTLRNPALVAKMATTADHISNGRAILGIGAAWFQVEHGHDGYNFGTGFGQRCDWLDESVSLITRLLAGETVTYGSRSPLSSVAGPAARAGRHRGSGEKKTLRTVAKYADIWNGIGSVEYLTAKAAILDAHCAEVGRDPAAIERTLNCQMIIRDDVVEARRVWLEALDHDRTDHDRVEPWLGSPATIAARLREHRAVGFRGVNVEVQTPYDFETIERLVNEVEPLVDAG